jgi:hypothetical protein
VLPEFPFGKVVTVLLLQQQGALKDRWWCHPVGGESVDLARAATQPDGAVRGKFTGWHVPLGPHLGTAPKSGGARLRRAVAEFEVFSFKFEAGAGLET